MWTEGSWISVKEERAWVVTSFSKSWVVVHILILEGLVLVIILAFCNLMTQVIWVT